MDLTNQPSDAFYISARKKGTEDSWQFVRRDEPGMRVPDPFAMEENDLSGYISRLERQGYETVVTEIKGRLINTDAGIWIGNPGIERIVRRIVDESRERQREFDHGYTGDLQPPRSK